MIDIDFLFKENSYDGVVLILDNNLKIVRASDKFLTLQGFDKLELYDSALSEIIVPEDKSLFFDNAYTVKTSNNFTLQMYHKTGAFRYYSFNLFNFKEFILLIGKPVKKDFDSYNYTHKYDETYISAFEDLDVEDISEIVASTNGELSTFMSVFPLDIWVKDPLGRYLFVNKTFTEHTGFNQDQIYLKDDFQIFEKEIAREFTNSDNLAISSKTKLNYIFESQNKALLAYTEVTKIPIYNIRGKYIGLLSFSIDISSFKKVEKIKRIEKNKLENILNNVEALFFELDTNLLITYMSGSLLEALKIDKTKYINRSLENFQTFSLEIGEKIKLVQQGQHVDFTSDIFGTSLKIHLHPFKNEDDVLSILGMGIKNEVDING